MTHHSFALATLAAALLFGCGSSTDPGEEDTAVTDTDVTDTTDTGDAATSDTGSVDTDVPDTDVPDTDVPDTDVPDTADTSDADPIEVFPGVGVYVIAPDGSGLELLLDPGTREVSHVRQRRGSRWLTGTRYAEDPDGNGYAREVEIGMGAHYAGTEIVVFDLDDPSTLIPVAGGVAERICANSSWTDEGELIYVQQDHPDNENFTRLKRLRFGEVPTIEAIDTVPLPADHFIPVDPDQHGTTASGFIVYTALVNGDDGWHRGVWRAPASGAESADETALVGCPMCGESCCAWDALEDVLGTNDARISPDGETVMWMQTHPDVSFGSPPAYPFRQVRRVGDAPQETLTPPDLPEINTQTFGEWRPDGEEVVYWEIGLRDGGVRLNLMRMAPDGSDRTLIPTPDDLCPTHPTYLDDGRIVFNAYHCEGTPCDCD